MGQEAFTIDDEPLQALQSRVAYLRKAMDDLSPMFEQFASDFYKTQKQILMLKGPGQYADLTPAYKVEKEKRHGFVYPILFATGKLMASLLSREGPDAVHEIKPKSFVIGTADPIGEYHHKGTSKMPRRPIFDESEDSPMIRRWARIADVYVQKLVEGAL
jgi:hypothetical protein